MPNDVLSHIIGIMSMTFVILILAIAVRRILMNYADQSKFTAFIPAVCLAAIATVGLLLALGEQLGPVWTRKLALDAVIAAILLFIIYLRFAPKRERKNGR